MQYAVIDYDNQTRREIGIDSDGTRQANLDHAELMPLPVATATATAHGGRVIAEDRLFNLED